MKTREEFSFPHVSSSALVLVAQHEKAHKTAKPTPPPVVVFLSPSPSTWAALSRPATDGRRRNVVVASPETYLLRPPSEACHPKNPAQHHLLFLLRIRPRRTTAVSA
jgi:hypothetical protein